MSRIFINKEKFTAECNKRIEAAKSGLPSLDGKEAMKLKGKIEGLETALEIAGIGENLIFLDWLVDDGK
jgi:hypothetical protein